MQFPTAYIRAECPLCHAAAPTRYYVAGTWECAKCGGRWSTRRLATVSAYDRFCEDRLSSTDVPLLPTRAA